MIDAFRFWFVVLYIVLFLFFLVAIVRFRRRGSQVERAAGLLPSPPALISWMIPPIIMVIQVGQFPAGWIFLRFVGVGLSLYAILVMPWGTFVLGRSYVPGPAVLQEHALIRSGPFRFVRHPIYSAVAALWLGAALGTLNWLLLLLWPMIVIGVTKQARVEEEMLRAKFGTAYDEYANSKGRLVPRFWVLR